MLDLSTLNNDRVKKKQQNSEKRDLALVIGFFFYSSYQLYLTSGTKHILSIMGISGFSPCHGCGDQLTDSLSDLFLTLGSGGEGNVDIASES